MAESTKRTWTGLFLYTVFSCLWAYAYQVVFVCVLLVGILVAASTCKARNLLSGVARAVWQAELWVHRLYVTDSVLCVPRVESITLGTVWWTFVYFLLTKAVLTAYFAAIFTSLLGEYTRFRVDSTPTLSPYVYRDRWQTQPPWYETSENSAAAIVITVLVSFIFNIYMFSSTLTERHGVVGFPVPPPPLRTSSSSGRLTDQHLQRTSRRASIPASPRPPQPPPQPSTRSKSSRKKDLALRTKHEHKLESMVDHARHQVQALHHILSTLKLHHDSHAVAHARRRLAVLNQLVAHAPLSQDERLQFELACHEFAAVLDNNNESDDESQQDDDAHVFDTVIESAQGHLRYIQHVWAATTTTDTTSVVPHETVSDLRGQLGAIIKSLQLVPPQWPRRQALEQQCHALDTDLTAWLVRQHRDKKEQLGRQLDAMQHTLVHGVGLSDDNKAQLQRICDDLEAKLVAMEHAPPPMP
ncbi:hypothetical protein DYB31_012096, partial [Aphanomyces astaci]